MKPTLISVFIILLSLLSFANEPACSEHSGKAALVIIDMQPPFVTRGGNHNIPENIEKVKKITEEQIAAIKKARENGIPVVFLEYVGFKDTNDDLKTAAQGHGDVKYILKNTDGMFEMSNSYREELSNYLKKHDIGTLIITGANGGACVEASIRGSLDNNCNVVAFSKGIADFNYRDFIYPYAGHYGGMRANCKNCTFREVSSLDEVSKYMIGSGRAPSTVPTNSNPARSKPEGYKNNNSHNNSPESVR